MTNFVFQPSWAVIEIHPLLYCEQNLIAHDVSENLRQDERS